MYEAEQAAYVVSFIRSSLD